MSELSDERDALLRASLPPRTLAGFGAAIVAVFAIAALSYQALLLRTKAVEDMRSTLEFLQQLEDLDATMVDAETAQRGFLLTANETYLEPYLQAVALLPRALESARASAADNPRQLERIELLARLSGEKMSELERTIAIKRSGGDALPVVRGGTGKALMDRIRDVSKELKDLERGELERSTEEWENAATVSATVTWAGSALLLFLIAAAASMSSRDLREHRIQGWLRAGQSRLAAAMQGEQDLEVLGSNIAGFLAGYLGARAGAVYFLEEGRGLRRVGAYALPAGDSSPPGGLTAQALHDNAVVHVASVPDDYFPVSSGLGKSKPRHLLIAPAAVDGKANAVVELAFFRAVDPHDLELLRRAGESIGMALRSCVYRKDLEALLEETQRQAEELQAQQEELRVSNEELEQQSRILQESQARLEAQQAEVEQINRQLETQTAAVEAQRDDLMRAQVELKRANTYKSEFLANMSHELRTPLNSSLILAKLLADNRGGNLTEEQVKFAQTIYSSGNDLLTLINDILDLSKVEAGKLAIRPETIAIPRLLDDLTTTFNPIAEEKKLQLSAGLESGAPASIATDPVRLQQILKNLISNALKFTERGGVTLRVSSADGDTIAFAVEDTGIGIPEDKHAVIFEAFRQAESSTNRKYGGTGLGLSISRDLARLLGGELRLESTPGRGSTFTLLLPAKMRVSATPPAVARPVPIPAPVAAPVPAAARAKKNAREILIIEDDEHFAGVIRDLAAELEFQTIVATNAREGLQLAEKQMPDAIVLDVGLPDRSGLTVLDALKHNPLTRHIPVHVISASDYTQTALEMGAAGYAIKPVQREELMEALLRLEAKLTQRMRRVLVVEDDPTHRESTCALLEADEVELVGVGTAAEALEKLAAETFDCMVLDLSLPDRTGFELLQELAQKEQRSFPPIIVYTGRSLSPDEEQQLRRYSQSIIIKGARSPERLLDEVTLFLHQVESELPADRQRLLRDARHREKVFEERRVLVVEDDVRNVFALSSVLEPRGAKVEIARNGLEAVRHLEEKPGVDLVLMDVMMPVMDGLEAMREIRKKPQLAKLPIIALTAKAMADDRDQCLAAGANDYIAKPLDVDKLLSLARVWMPK